MIFSLILCTKVNADNYIVTEICLGRIHPPTHIHTKKASSYSLAISRLNVKNVKFLQTIVNLLSSSVMTIIGLLTIPAPFTVEATTVIL